MSGVATIARRLVALGLAGALSAGAAEAQPSTAMLRYENGTRLYAMGRYVEAAGAPGYDMAQLRARIQRLRGALSTAQPADAVVAGPAMPPPRRPAAPGAPVGPIVLMSVGGAALVAVIPLWASARSTHADLTAVCPMRTCPSVFEGDARRATTFALAGDVLLGAGAASLAAGVTWLLLDRRGARAEGGPRATLDCAAGGCIAGVAGRF